MKLTLSESEKKRRGFPQLKHLVQSSLQGDNHPNEDVCGFTSKAAWMIDGATSVLEPLGLPGITDPSWYARTLDLILAQASHEADNAKNLLNTALGRMDTVAQKLVGDERVRFPSAAISVVFLHEDGALEVLSLADCHVVVADSDGVVHHLSATGKRQPTPALGLKVLGSKLPGLKVTEEVELRRRRNTPNGLWVARREPEAVHHAFLDRIEDVRSLCLASDGAWRVSELGLFAGPAEFLAATSTPTGAAEVQLKLRQFQAEIGEKADDSTILTLKVLRSQLSRK